MHLIILKYPIHFLAYGFGFGLIPVMPGTFGTLVGVGILYFLLPLDPTYYLGLIFAGSAIGVFICGQTAKDLGKNDPGKIVWDEIIGFLVAMFLIPFTWSWVLIGFIIFRIFDIWKPYPIKIIEKTRNPGLGIMADDIIAGLYTVTCLHIIRWCIEIF
ncbi:MAG: phosphatidylglycerophosphatase A [Rhodospirillaceae bacterium]|nr:phosphatidylglycerophosphatase A [Rhodospirillaceae bacterium]|tara:strand:+ start:8625 stop:9098 length:474 start_codon:yes stop_codon:yes gene_type:complete